MKIKQQNPWWLLLGAGITAASLFLLYQLIVPNLEILLEVRNHLNIGPILLTFPIYLAGVFASSIVWSSIMNALARPLPIRQHQIIYVITNFAKRFPGTIWHVLGRIAWYERFGVPKGITTFANILEPVLVVISGLLMTSFFLFFWTIRTGIYSWQILVVFFLGIALTHPRVIQIIMRKLGQEVPSDKINYPKIFRWVLYFMGIWLSGGTVLFLIIRAMTGATISLWPVCVAAWCAAGVAGTLVVFLPSGFGLSEATISVILSAYIPSSIAVGAAIFLRILLTAYEFLFAVLLLYLRKWLLQSEIKASNNSMLGE